jgi:hypothetical protein
MRILSLIGSLTAGATLAVGLFQLPIVARVALLVIAVVALLLIRAVNSARSEAPRAAYIVDKESERYSSEDVAEFFAGLSKAKISSVPHFDSSASHRLNHDEFDER